MNSTVALIVNQSIRLTIIQTSHMIFKMLLFLQIHINHSNHLSHQRLTGKGRTQWDSLWIQNNIKLGNTEQFVIIVEKLKRIKLIRTIRWNVNIMNIHIVFQMITLTSILVTTLTINKVSNTKMERNYKCRMKVNSKWHLSNQSQYSSIKLKIRMVITHWWWGHLQGRRETVRTQVKCSTWCRNTPTTLLGLRKHAWESPSNAAYRCLKCTSGVGTWRTKRMSMVSIFNNNTVIIDLWCSKFTGTPKYIVSNWRDRDYQNNPDNKVKIVF